MIPTIDQTGQRLWPLHFVPLACALFTCVLTVWHPLLAVMACYFTWEGAVSWCYYHHAKYDRNVWESPSP